MAEQKPKTPHRSSRNLWPICWRFARKIMNSSSALRIFSKSTIDLCQRSCLLSSSSLESYPLRRFVAAYKPPQAQAPKAQGRMSIVDRPFTHYGATANYPSYIRPIQSGSSFTLYSNLDSCTGSNSITREFSTTNKKEGSGNGAGNGAGSGSGQGKGRGSYGRKEQGISLLLVGVVCYLIKPLVGNYDLRRICDAIAGICVALGLILIVVSIL